MTFYTFVCSHWWKIYLKRYPLQDLLSSQNAVISTKKSTQIITGHVIYKPAYTYKFQLKTTLDCDFNEPIFKNSTIGGFLFKTDTESDSIYLDNELSLCLKETQVCCKKSQSRLPETSGDFFEIKSGTVFCPIEELS